MVSVESVISQPIRGLFHVHTTHSHDGKSSLGDLVRFCRENRYSFLCITDHADFLNDADVRSLVRDCEIHSEGGVRVIPGLEYAFPGEGDVHLLCVGVRESIRPRSIEEAVDQVRIRSGLAIIAHPSRNGHYIPEEIISKIDGIEVWNATYDSRYLPDSGSIILWKYLLSRNQKIKAYAGLDMHDLQMFREISLVLSEGMPESEADLIEELRQGRFRSEGRHFSIAGDNPPSFWTGQCIKVGRHFLQQADRIMWAWKRRQARTRRGMPH